MVLVLELTSKERNELGQAVNDHLRALRDHGKAPGRVYTTEILLEKIWKADDQHEERRRIS